MRALRSLFKRRARTEAFRSQEYWRQRYVDGGNSGSGSYGRLAKYKADYINRLVVERSVGSLIEFGSGDGNQCALLTCDNYSGVDISADVVAICRARFADRPGWRFLTDRDYQASPFQADLTMSLDVIYHLVEDSVFHNYMQTLFSAASRMVLIYSSDDDQPSRASHVRHRAYSDWIRLHAAEFALLDAPPHPYPMVKGADPRTTSLAAFKLFAKPGANR